MQSKPAFGHFIALVSLITLPLWVGAQADSLKVGIDSSLGKFDPVIDTIKEAESNISKDAIESKVNYTARDTIKYNFETSKIFLFGDAVVTYEDIELKAAYIELTMDSNIVFARGVKDSSGNLTGNPIFKEGDQEFKSRKMTYNFDTEKGKIEDVITQEGEGYIHGKDVKKTGDDIIFIENGSYTTCDHEHPHFSFAAKKLKIIPNDKIIAKPANLVIEDVPTPVLVPFGIFPNRQGGKSGILVPVPGESQRDGFYVQNIGYYFYINDKSELQVESDIYSKGSFAFRPSYNYKTRYKRSGSLKFRYKRTVNGIIPEDPSYSVINDYWLDWNHRQDAKARPNSTFSANVNLGSSTSFRNDINTPDQDFLQNNFQSKISYSKYMLQRKLNLSLNARQNQNNNNGTINLTLPEANLTLARIYPFKSKKGVGTSWTDKVGLSYTGNFRNELSVQNRGISNENRDSILGNFRNGASHSIPVSTNFKIFKHFTLNPTLNYRENWFFTTTQRNWERLPDDSLGNQRDTVYDTEIPGFSRTNAWDINANLTTKIYGLVQMRKGPIKAFRHVLTPTIGVSYKPENRQGIATYRDTLYDAEDPKKARSPDIEYSIYEGQVYRNLNSAESGRINFGLLNNFEMKVKSNSDSADGVKKIKLLENFRLSSAYDMIADSLNWSDVSMSGFTKLTKNIDLQFGGTYDLYALDSIGKRVFTVNRFEYNENGRFARMTRANFTLNFNFNSKKGKKKGQQASNEDGYETGENNENAGLRRDYVGVDWDVPWNLSVNYNINYSKPEYQEEITQSLRANGDLSITKNWKFQYETWFDFETSKVSYARLGILRNLHCWEMKMDWVPLGPRQNYSFYIGVRANLLQELKYEKRDF
ncbi:MAG: putative LPS assembly protein LptD [Vicingaceae bacterium]